MDSKAPQVSGALPRTPGVPAPAAERVKKHDSGQKSSRNQPPGKAAGNVSQDRAALQDRAASARTGTQAPRIHTGLPARPGSVQSARADGPARPHPLSPAPAITTAPAGTAAPALQDAKPDAPQALRSLLLSLGLPAGSLSAFLISSFKYFSLPMDPASLAKIRKQLGRLASPGCASSLGAAAAASKGAGLSDETLAEYAEAIDPGRNLREKGGRAYGGQSPSKRKSLTGAALAGEIAALSGEIDARWTLLNRLPGRNGNFWMVFPLHCSVDGSNFDITLRLLLENRNSLPLTALRLAVDIIAAKGRRLFVLDRPGEGGGARIFLKPLPSETEQARIKTDLYRALSPLVCGVKVLEADTALFAFDGEDGFPLPVDEKA